MQQSEPVYYETDPKRGYVVFAVEDGTPFCIPLPPADKQFASRKEALEYANTWNRIGLCSGQHAPKYLYTVSTGENPVIERRYMLEGKWSYSGLVDPP